MLWAVTSDQWEKDYQEAAAYYYNLKHLGLQNELIRIPEEWDGSPQNSCSCALLSE